MCDTNADNLLYYHNCRVAYDEISVDVEEYTRCACVIYTNYYRSLCSGIEVTV